MIAGRVPQNSDLERRVDEAEAHIAAQRIQQQEAEARIAELSIQQNRGSQTSQTAQKLGSVGLLAISHQACMQNGMLAHVCSQ